jgi:hypothetical protein
LLTTGIKPSAEITVVYLIKNLDNQNILK